jgi:predicted ester cyclase
VGNINHLWCLRKIERPVESRIHQQYRPEGLKQFISLFRAGFPDLHFTIEDMIAAGDTVVVRQTYRGTHKGELMGISPTGKQVTITSIDIGRFTGGKLVEHWGATDSLGLLQQLGVVPPLGQTS